MFKKALCQFKPWDQTNLVLNSIENVKPGSLLSLMCMLLESNGTKFSSHSFHLQTSGILQTRIVQRGDPMKTNFDIFQIKKWISQTVRAQSRWKKWDHLSSFLFPILSYGPEIVENSAIFANLCWPQQEI